MPITLTGLFRYEKKSFNIMKRLHRLEADGCKVIYIRQGEYISIKKMKYILYKYSKEGYELKDIETLIRSCNV